MLDLVEPVGHQPAIGFAGESGDALLGFLAIAIADADGGEVYAERGSHGLGRVQEFNMGSGVGVHQHRRPRDRGRSLFQ